MLRARMHTLRICFSLWVPRVSLSPTSHFPPFLFLVSSYVCICVFMYVQSTLSAEYGSTGYRCQSCSRSLNRGFGLARRVRPSRPAPVRSFSLLRLNVPGAYSWYSSRFPRRRLYIYTVNHAIGSVPGSIGSRHCVLMVFTAESLPTQGQWSSI